MIAIVDYGLGNVKAFANIYNELSIPYVVARAPAELDGATKIILPGVGAFDQAMMRLEAAGLRTLLDDRVLNGGVPILGICVGMQVLMKTSEEGVRPGLGWVDGDVVKFSPGGETTLAVPHMGWNDVTVSAEDPLWRGLERDARFYFLHSYYVRCRDRTDVLAVTSYGSDFVCGVKRANVYGVQFHPEKSHRYGVQLLKNFADL